MLLAFVATACAMLFVSLGNGVFTKKIWTAIVVFSLFFPLVVSYASTIDVWSPNTTILNIHYGTYEGTPVLSKLSFPFYLSVYHTPLAQHTYDGVAFSGNAFFHIILVSVKVLDVHGKFSYNPVFWDRQSSYSIEFPPFNSGERFFALLVILLTIFNIAGSVLGIVIPYEVLRRRRSGELTHR